MLTTCMYLLGDWLAQLYHEDALTVDTSNKGSMCMDVLCFGKSYLYSKPYFTVVK